MKKIFVFWIIFLVVLFVGIVLAISSRSVLNREEKRAEELKKVVIPRTARPPRLPAAAEIKTEQSEAQAEPSAKTETAASGETPAAPSAPPELPASGEIPPMQNNIPVQINTNSLEISIPASQPPAPAQEPQQNPTTPLAGQ